MREGTKMAFPSSFFIVFFAFKNGLLVSSAQKKILFGIKGDKHHHKSNMSVIQGIKWNHALMPPTKGTLNTSTHGLQLYSRSDSLFLTAPGSDALRHTQYTQRITFFLIILL